MKALERRQFGDPISWRRAKTIAIEDIKSAKIQALIKNMSHTLATEKIGVGLAAPQVGKSLSLAVVRIRPLPHRAKVKPLDMVLINPEITETFGRKKQVWEGCISAGHKNAGVFAKVPRHETIKVKYYDQTGNLRQRKLTGLPAQVVQHEIDHLQGVLFVDRVKDTRSYMTYAEYVKRIRNKQQ